MGNHEDIRSLFISARTRSMVYIEVAIKLLRSYTHTGSEFATSWLEILAKA